MRNMTYYGIIKEIIELNYRNNGNIVLFKCDWVDNRIQDKWVKQDQFGVTSVNLNHLFNTGENMLDEPFIFASQDFVFTLLLCWSELIVDCLHNQLLLTSCINSFLFFQDKRCQKQGKKENLWSQLMMKMPWSQMLLKLKGMKISG